MTSQWSQEDFIALLYVHAINADFKLIPEKMEYAKEKVSEDRLERMMSAYERLSDYQISELISEHGKIHCPSDEEKDRIIADLKELFIQDHHFSQVEQNFLLGIRHLL